MIITYNCSAINKRKLKAQFRKEFGILSDDANALVDECTKIYENINLIAYKSFGGKGLSKNEKSYLDSLPLDKDLKSKLWQSAMFSQFR